MYYLCLRTQLIVLLVLYCFLCVKYSELRELAFASAARPHTARIADTPDNLTDSDPSDAHDRLDPECFSSSSRSKPRPNDPSEADSEDAKLAEGEAQTQPSITARLGKRSSSAGQTEIAQLGERSSSLSTVSSARHAAPADAPSGEAGWGEHATTTTACVTMAETVSTEEMGSRSVALLGLLGLLGLLMIRVIRLISRRHLAICRAE